MLERREYETEKEQRKKKERKKKERKVVFLELMIAQCFPGATACHAIIIVLFIFYLCELRSHIPH